MTCQQLVISHEWLQTEQPDDIMNTVRDDLLSRSDWRLTVIDQVRDVCQSIALPDVYGAGRGVHGLLDTRLGSIPGLP